MPLPPLTIALPTSTFLPSAGGAEVGLHNIASRLAAWGHRPVVIASEPQWRALQEQGWRLPYAVEPFPGHIWGILRRWPTLGFFLLDRFFGRMQKRFAFDFWHATMGYPVGVALARFARRRPGFPHLVRCAGEDIQKLPEIGYGARLDPKIDALVTRWLPCAQKLVAITESVAGEYRALGIDEGRIVPIPNGVDTERFARPVNGIDVRERWGIPQSAKLFLSVGRNHPKKNFAALVRAAGFLKQSGFGAFRVMIVGAGADALQPLITELGLADIVIPIEGISGKLSGADPQANIAGPVNVKQDKQNLSRAEEFRLELPADELVALYQAADIFVFPSLLETFGIVLVEAMAAGLPIITTDAPGCRDLIRRGEDGVMVARNSETALADAMARLGGDPEACRIWAAKSRVRAQAFSWDTVTRKYVDLYRQGIAQSSACKR